MTPGTIVDYMGNHGNKDSNGNDNNNSDSSNNNNDSNTNDSSDDDDSSDDNNGNDDTNNDNNDNNSNDDTNKKNNNNINSMSLPPLAAVGYVLMEQKCSLFGLQYKEDPTVVLLYQIAKEALQHQIQDRNSTVERLIKVATKTKKQFKRILEVPNEDKTSTQRKNEKFGKFLDDSGMIPTPLDLPPNVQPPKGNTHVDILPPMPSEPQLDNMKYAREFKE